MDITKGCRGGANFRPKLVQNSIHHPNPSDQVKATHLAIEESPMETIHSTPTRHTPPIWKQNINIIKTRSDRYTQTPPTPWPTSSNGSRYPPPHVKLKTNKQDIAKQDHYNKSAQHESWLRIERKEMVPQYVTHDIRYDNYYSCQQVQRGQKTRSAHQPMGRIHESKSTSTPRLD